MALNNKYVCLVFLGAFAPIFADTPVWMPEEDLFGNPGIVQSALDKLYDEGALDEIFFALEPLSIDDLDGALDSIHPAMFKGATVVQENNAVSVRSALSQRFQIVLDDSHPSTCEKRMFQVWSSGFGDFLYQSNSALYDNIFESYQANTGGFVSGVDYQISKGLYLGVLGSYTHSSITWECDWGHTNIDTGYAGLYTSAIGDLFYANVSVIGGWSCFKGHRNIFFTGVDVVTNNRHQGQQLITHLDTGLNFLYKEITIRPFDSIDWIVQKEHGYIETGGGEYNLQVHRVEANMLRNELGFNFATCGYFIGTKLIADAKVSWVYEARLHGKQTQSQFVGTDVPFTVIGYFPNRNLGSMGCSLTASLLQKTTPCTQDILLLSLYYNGTFGSNYFDDSISAQLNYNF